VLVPNLANRDLIVVLALRAAREVAVAVTLNGHGLGSIPAGSETPTSRLRLPREALYRGDNLLGLGVQADPQTSITLASLELQPAESGERTSPAPQH